MPDITYIDRLTKKEGHEKVYGRIFLELLYGEGQLQRCMRFFLLPLFAHVAFLSRLYGVYQKSRLSRFKVKPFIDKFGVDTSEFFDSVDSFGSFNDFFIRKLKPTARPIKPGLDVAVLPADGRYLVFPHLQELDDFWVKGKKFNLAQLLQDTALTERFQDGAMAIARLCPTDYHRYHFPCHCVPGQMRLINGPLYSVNPMALKYNMEILSENKRVITPLATKYFGTVLFIEVGATYVGSIHQTSTPLEPYAKGDEKGYFSFGGSCIILLFEKGRILFDQDLVDNARRKFETRGLLGQSLGRALNI